FFLPAPPTTDIYTLSLHDALPIFTDQVGIVHPAHTATFIAGIYGETTSDAGSAVPVYIDMNGNLGTAASSERFKTAIKPMDETRDRKSTRLNSSHRTISYAVFCLK